MRSIRQRTLALLLSILLISLGLMSWRSYRDAQHEIEELFDAQLAQSARLVQGLVGHDMDQPTRQALQAALDQVFQGDAGAETGEGETPGAVDPTDPTTPVDPGDATAQERARTLLDEAEALFKGADEALVAGDLGDYQAKMKAAEAKVLEAVKALDE